MDSPGDEMLYCAHASAYHWMHGGGTTANRARSEWLCSRVYSILGRPEPALHHARRCLELVESAPAEMEDWDLAGAHEALRARPSRRRRAGRGTAQLRAGARGHGEDRQPGGREAYRGRPRRPEVLGRVSQRPRRMVETSRTSGSGGRRHSNGRIRARCQLDRRPTERRRREKMMRRARPARRAVLSRAAALREYGHEQVGTSRSGRRGSRGLCSAPPTAGSTTTRTHAHCPSHAQIASLPRWRFGGRLRADVDGDGRKDTATVRVARWADGRCAFYLTVSTANGVYSRALGPWTLEMPKDNVNVPMRRGSWPAASHGRGDRRPRRPRQRRGSLRRRGRSQSRPQLLRAVRRPAPVAPVGRG